MTTEESRGGPVSEEQKVGGDAWRTDHHPKAGKRTKTSKENFGLGYEDPYPRDAWVNLQLMACRGLHENKA